MLFVGVDPGEAWCGVAVLRLVSDTILCAEARTYSIRQRGGYLGMVHSLVDILPHNGKTRVIVENYQIRGVGHQRFSKGNTLRMIGALEYAISQIPAFTWHLVPPGNPKEVKKLFGNSLRSYEGQFWPHIGDDRWNHCDSAWRVLGRHLLSSEYRSLLMRLRKSPDASSIRRWLPTARKSKDLIADAAQWRLK